MPPMIAPSSVMLFAAGFGTRMRPLTDTVPKPLVRVAGVTLLDHALALCAAAGIRQRVVNAHYRADQIAAHLEDRSDVAISLERDRILDTGGGLKAARPFLAPGPVYTLNTDAVWTGPNVLGTLRDAWDPGQMEALLACVPAERATGHMGTGDFALGRDGLLHRGGPLVFTGAQILNPACLDRYPERAFSLNRVWDDMATAGRLYGVIHTGGWCDVGRPAAIPLAEALLRGAA